MARRLTAAATPAAAARPESFKQTNIHFETIVSACDMGIQISFDADGITEPVLDPGKTKTALNADLSKSETSMLVPKQYPEPNRIHEFGVLATEKYGNQTITEGGVFCTRPMATADCEAP